MLVATDDWSKGLAVAAGAVCPKGPGVGAVVCPKGALVDAACPKGPPPPAAPAFMSESIALLALLPKTSGAADVGGAVEAKGLGAAALPVLA